MLRSLLVDTVPLRLFRNEEWDILLPHLSDARPYVFRQLSVADTACVALLMNHNFAGKAEGATCSLTPLLRRVAKKAGVRVTDPRNASPPKDWSVTFDSRAFPRVESDFRPLSILQPTGRPSAPFYVPPTLLSMGVIASINFR